MKRAGGWVLSLEEDAKSRQAAGDGFTGIPWFGGVGSLDLGGQQTSWTSSCYKSGVRYLSERYTSHSR